MGIPKLSIIIPHKETILNDAALLLNITRLLENTVYDFELIIDNSQRDPYAIWNDASARAKADTLIFTNSDVIMAWAWDQYFINCESNCIITGYLVEPGSIGVAEQNIHKDFGRIPYTFDVTEFEKFASDRTVEFIRIHNSDFIYQRGWYMPCAVNKDWFLSTGGFDTSEAFPAPNDIKFWEHCIKDYGTKLKRVPSYAYHFQNLSSRSPDFK